MTDQNRKHQHTRGADKIRAASVINNDGYDPHRKSDRQIARELSNWLDTYIAPTAVPEILEGAGVDRIPARNKQSASKRGDQSEKLRTLSRAIIRSLRANFDDPYIDPVLGEFADRPAGHRDLNHSIRRDLFDQDEDTGGENGGGYPDWPGS